MATYINDLRLKEISTGDESGTWGTSTNTNLELIGEALGYATQEVFGSDADATTTIADGASDPARAMYFKITSAGSLTATRTCTIAPNTVSRVMFIENATTGSQSIAISQGSGANVTIATGKTAVVYLDGAGAGAAVVDAMLGVDPGVTDTLSEVLVAGNTTGGTDLAVSTGDDITFADSSKAIFGAGSDLQIYHDGSHSYVSDQGTGNLRVLAENFQVRNPANNEAMIIAIPDSGVTLYHDNAAKLATTATGIDVTGTVTATGTSVFASLDISGDIDVDGTANLDVVDIDGAVDFASTTAHAGDATFADNAKAIFGTGSDLQIYHVGDNSYVLSNTGSLILRSDSFRVLNTANSEQILHGDANGAVTAYYDNAVKLATTATGIDVTGGIDINGAAPYIKFLDTSGDAYAKIDADSPDEGTIRIQADPGNSGANSIIRFDVDGSERLRIDGAGNVGIGTATTTAIRLTATTATANHIGLQVENSNTADSFGMVVKAGNDANDYTADFRKRDNTTIMRILGDGNVGIGTSSPASPTGFGSSGILHLKGATGNDCSIVLEGLSGSGGRQEIGASGGALQFYRGAATGSMSESMRIDSSGNLLLNRTSVFTTAKMEIQSDAGDASTLALNSIDTDGSILSLYKAGTIVGSIGAVGGDVAIYSTGSSHAGLRFAINSYLPTNNAGAVVDATTDFGTGAYRYKDLYLSGFVSGGGNTGLTTRAVVNGGVTALRLQQVRGSVTSPTVSASNGDGNYIQSEVYDGSAFNSIAYIGMVTGTSLDDGDIVFGTAKAGSTTVKMTLDEDGNLLVGTTTVPALAGLAVGSTGLGKNINVFSSSNGNNGLINVFQSNGTLEGQLYAGTGDVNLYAPSVVKIVASSGGVKLTSGATSWVSNSDERAKDIIEPISNAVQKVSTLRSVIGKYKTDSEGTRRSFLIAQDVQAVLPEAVDATDEDNLGVRYTETIPLLVAAMKEQQATIEALTARIAALES